MVNPEVFQEVKVICPSACYSIVIGRHLLNDAVRLSAVIQGTQVLVVTNETIAPFYGEDI